MCSECQKIKHNVTVLRVSVRKSRTMWQCSVSVNQRQCHNAQTARKSNTMLQCSACQKIKHNVTVLGQCQKIRQCDSAQRQIIRNNVTMLRVSENQTMWLCSVADNPRQCHSAQHSGSRELRSINCRTLPADQTCRRNNGGLLPLHIPTSRYCCRHWSLGQTHPLKNAVTQTTHTDIYTNVLTRMHVDAQTVDTGTHKGACT